jgi:predicted nuclease with TOPRIM domain
VNNDEKILKALETLQADVTSMKGDITTLKGDVTSMKGDIVSLKGDVTTLKDGQVRLEKEAKASEERLMKKIDQRSEQLIDVITDTATAILEEQYKRISQIEDHLGLSRPPKN